MSQCLLVYCIYEFNNNNTHRHHNHNNIVTYMLTFSAIRSDLVQWTLLRSPLPPCSFRLYADRTIPTSSDIPVEHWLETKTD